MFGQTTGNPFEEAAKRNVAADLQRDAEHYNAQKKAEYLQTTQDVINYGIAHGTRPTLPAPPASAYVKDGQEFYDGPPVCQQAVYPDIVTMSSKNMGSFSAGGLDPTLVSMLTTIYYKLLDVEKAVNKS